MSPTAFKQQVATLLSELLECDNIIEAIRANRRLGTTEKLDRLQSGLQESRSNIEADFNDWRRVVGSRMEFGDEMSRSVLARAITDLRGTVQKKLKDVAMNKVRERHEREVPGFGELYRRWQAIEITVTQATHTLGDRLEAANLNPNPPHSPAPMPSPKPQPQEPARPQPKSDEAIISIKELVLLTDHLKNSWVEQSVGGRSCFVNMFDEREICWERPNGFVKMLPVQARAVRRPHFEDEPEPERVRRPAREDSWNNGRGW